MVLDTWTTETEHVDLSLTFSSHMARNPNVNTKTLNGEITDGMITHGEITSGGKSEGYRLFAKPMWQPLCKMLAHSDIYFKEFRSQEIAIPLSATGSEDRTPRRTHLFVSLVIVPHLIALFTRTCVRVAQVKLVT